VLNEPPHDIQFTVRTQPEREDTEMVRTNALRHRGANMRRILGVVIGLVVPVAFLVSPAGAAVGASTGDTCAATGNGTAYTLIITLPGDASGQGGFAFGAAGVTVTNINIAGDTGTLSTQNLPANTTGQWLMSSPPRPGESITAAVTTTGPVTGSFTVVAASSPPSSTSFSPFLCAVSTGTAVASNVFTVNQHTTYNSAARAWHLAVTVAGAGTVTGIQASATAAGSGSKAVATKSLIQTRKVVTKSGGTFALTLTPTASGNAALKKNGSIKLTMTVAFNPKDGKPASKELSLTLKK
jgi:hypothetical protein